MVIDLLGGSYKNRYLELNGERTINWYPVVKFNDKEKNKYQLALFPCPGLTTVTTTAGTLIKGIFTARTLTEERCFIVSDNTLYELTDVITGDLTNRGTLTDISVDLSPVYMEVNGNRQVMIANVSASYIFDLSTNILTKITDADFPSNVSSLSYMNGYFIVSSGGRIYFSNLNDGLNWTASDVITPTFRADNVISSLAWRDDLYCFGSETTETYMNDGVTPFSHEPKSSIDLGIFHNDTLCKFNDGFIFLGRTRTGEAAVYFYNGREYKQVSPFSITWQINNTSSLGGLPWNEIETPWDAWEDPWGFGDSYASLVTTKDGHVMYYLTIPTLSTTYVYDLSEDIWYERQSLSPSTSTNKEFRGKYFTVFQGVHIFSDLHSGKIFKEDYSNFTEDGSTITRTRISPIVSEELKNISIYSVEIDCNKGQGLASAPATSPTIAVSWSKDGGNTFSTARSLNTGASGSYTTRVKTHKLGTARNWVFKLVNTDNADIMIQGAVANGVVDAY